MSPVLKLGHLRLNKLVKVFKKKDFSADFQNAVIPQPVDGFLCSTPEMKARDAYVPFLLYKPLNKIVLAAQVGPYRVLEVCVTKKSVTLEHVAGTLPDFLGIFP